MKTVKSQDKMILESLQAGNMLTPLDALKLFGCFRLSARIYSLKKAGHPIRTIILPTLEGKRIALYYLRPEDIKISKECC
jgi:hypothetical protein